MCEQRIEFVLQKITRLLAKASIHPLFQRGLSGVVSPLWKRGREPRCSVRESGAEGWFKKVQVWTQIGLVAWLTRPSWNTPLPHILLAFIGFFSYIFLPEIEGSPLILWQIILVKLIKVLCSWIKLIIESHQKVTEVQKTKGFFDSIFTPLTNNLFTENWSFWRLLVWERVLQCGLTRHVLASEARQSILPTSAWLDGLLRSSQWRLKVCTHILRKSGQNGPFFSAMQQGHPDTYFSAKIPFFFSFKFLLFPHPF